MMSFLVAPWVHMMMAVSAVKVNLVAVGGDDAAKGPVGLVGPGLSEGDDKQIQRSKIGMSLGAVTSHLH